MLSVNLQAQRKSNNSPHHSRYQQIFSYLLVNKNSFPINLYIKGRRPTIIALIKGKLSNNRNDISTANHYPSILRTEAPR